MNNNGSSEIEMFGNGGNQQLLLPYDNFIARNFSNQSQFDEQQHTINNNNNNISLVNSQENIGNLVMKYYTPILVAVGTLGNALSVFVFFATGLRKLSSSYYLAGLAINDTCFLLTLFMAWLGYLDADIYSWNGFCQLFTFLSFLCSFLSVWFVVAFTVERFIAVRYPLKRQTMCTLRRAKMVLAGLVMTGVCLYAPILWLAEPVYKESVNDTECGFDMEFKHHMTIYNYLDTVIVLVIPFTIIVVLNSITGLTVWKVDGLRRSMTIKNGKTNIQNCRKSLCMPNQHPIGGNSGFCLNTQPERKTGSNSSQIKVTKMLLIVSTVFVCLNLPSYVMRLQAYIKPEATHTTLIIQCFCLILFYTSFGINFALYCVSGQNFRNAVITIFSHHIVQRQPQESGTQVTVSELIRSVAGSTASKRMGFPRNTSCLDVHEMHIMHGNK